VTKERYASLGEALAALERLVSDGARPEPARNVLGRTYAPVRQVAGRFELRGRGVRGGVDLRGDGSAEAFRGSIRKSVIVPEPGESAVAALARALRGAG
jgi:hypothetical protein